MKILKVNESLATCLVSVSGKCLEVPALREALRAEAFSAWTARRLVSRINNQNAEEFIAFAKHNTHAAIDFKLNPSGTSTRRISNSLKILMKKVQDLIAQKEGRHPSPDEVDLIVYQAYYLQHHPEEKAKRYKARKTAQQKTNKDLKTAATSMDRRFRPQLRRG